MKRQQDISNPFGNVPPDVELVVQHSTKTGATVIKSGNGKPLNSLLIAQLCMSVGKANLDNYVAQAQGIIRADQRSEQRSADNPPHNFVATTDNPMICSYCASHKANHRHAFERRDDETNECKACDLPREHERHNVTAVQ